MHKETYKRLDILKTQIEKERQELHTKIFEESHPNLLPGDHAHNRREVARYLKFHESGFDSEKAINELVVLDRIIEDIAWILYIEEVKKK